MEMAVTILLNSMYGGGDGGLVRERESKNIESEWQWLLLCFLMVCVVLVMMVVW